MGSSVPFARELDPTVASRARLYVDRRESALHGAGDVLLARRDGAIRDDHIMGELGEVLLGRLRPCEGREEITLFKSVGLAVEDLAAAHHVYSQAAVRGLGAWIALGGTQATSGPSVEGFSVVGW